MRNFIVFLLIQLAAVQSSFAEPVALKCRASTGEKTVDLTIDVANRRLKWGLDYDIIHIDDTYISAYERTTGVGGEIFVINRISGVYKRGAVGIYHYNVENLKPGDEGSFEAHIYEGRCSKQQF